MNELAQMVSQKFGLSPEISQQIIEFVVGQVKSKLPEGMSSQVEGLLGGAAPAETGGLMEKVKSMAAGMMHKE